MQRSYSLPLSIIVCLLTVQAWAGDWPQFRYDLGRTAASPHELPANLQLLSAEVPDVVDFPLFIVPSQLKGKLQWYPV